MITTARRLLVMFALALPCATSAEPVRVDNDVPARPDRTIGLEADWSVGGEDGDLVLGWVVDSLADADGNVYLLDSQLSQIEVIGPSGEHLQTLSREGDGPGELRLPQDLVWMPDGSLGVVQLFPGSIVKLALNGDPMGRVVIGGEQGPQTGFVATLSAECRGGTLVIAGQRTTPSDGGQFRTQFLASFGDGGHELARYREATMTLEFSAPKFVERDLLPSFLLASAVGPDGRVYVASNRNRYEIEVYGPDGGLERIICRDFHRLKRDARAQARINALVDAWMQGFPAEFARELDEHEPTITEMHVDADGVLWVQHSRSGLNQPDGVLLSFDTFTSDGAYLQRVGVRAEGNPLYDGIRFLGDGRALVINGYVLARWTSRGAQNATFGEEDETGPMQVTCCRITE